jgi:uncharacterized protein (DUF2342 family)
VLAPPHGEALEQAERLLGILVEGHLMLVFTALLGEGADSLVDPLVTVDLLLARSLERRRAGSDDAIDAGLIGWKRWR